MKGFVVLLALASIALLLICGPPAAVQGEDQMILQSEFIGGKAIQNVDQIPGISPAGLQVVPDPGSCGGQFEAVASTNLSKIEPVQRGRNIIRQGVRLLNFLPCC